MPVLSSPPILRPGMLNQTAEYALRTAVHLAGQGPDASLRTSDLAEALDIPVNYLSKILHQLTRAGLLHSQRGKSGGFRLARPAAAITLAEVVEPFDPVDARRSCLLGRAVCSDASPCAAHARWKEIGVAMSRFFHGTTLAQLANGHADPPPALTATADADVAAR